MNVAYAYRYNFASDVVSQSNGLGLRLATSGGGEPNPYFFQGRLLYPREIADQLLTLSQVVSYPSQRGTYKPSGRVEWGIFLPLYGATLLVAMLLAGVMYWLFSVGQYWMILVLIFAALLLGWALVLLIFVPIRGSAVTTCPAGGGWQIRQMGFAASTLGHLLRDVCQKIVYVVQGIVVSAEPSHPAKVAPAGERERGSLLPKLKPC